MLEETQCSYKNSSSEAAPRFQPFPSFQRLWKKVSVLIWWIRSFIILPLSRFNWRFVHLHVHILYAKKTEQLAISCMCLFLSPFLFCCYFSHQKLCVLLLYLSNMDKSFKICHRCHSLLEALSLTLPYPAFYIQVDVLSYVLSQLFVYLFPHFQ